MPGGKRKTPATLPSSPLAAKRRETPPPSRRSPRQAARSPRRLRPPTRLPARVLLHRHQRRRMRRSPDGRTGTTSSAMCAALACRMPHAEPHEPSLMKQRPSPVCRSVSARWRHGGRAWWPRRRRRLLLVGERLSSSSCRDCSTEAMELPERSGMMSRRKPAAILSVDNGAVAANWAAEGRLVRL